MKHRVSTAADPLQVVVAEHRPFPRNLSMALFGLAAVCCFLLTACGRGDKAPDVSGVKVNEVHIVRYDTAWFNLDSSNVVSGLRRLSQQYPWFTGDFVGGILGAGPLSDTSTVAFAASRAFLSGYQPVRKFIEAKYPKLDWLERDLTQAFRYFKYYFPRYELPEKVVSFIGPVDGYGVVVTQHALAVGLQSFAGKDAPFYSAGQDPMPLYITRRFEPAFIVPNCVNVLMEDLFIDSSDGRPMLEQMIIKGRYWWLASKLQPTTPDSLRTGYMQSQLDWCSRNQRDIWNFFLQNTDIYTLDPEIIKNYIGDAPKTQGMPDASPGNIGTWVGWKIVEKYVADHPGVTPEMVMRTPARRIFEEAKYKPK